ncbi:uncharacterized protein EDB91DRAFT_1333288 [Suillus paluster]|uniref:uncharacterized protein n=1 Tax=Suillus paluster TaxID=48578 RepID=UPI001B85CCE1|nr:uncharacterized protein EDB91DRAFT_1333288 [Suillus paluster]KAG1753992.1 hypothetical protein EDB91DRAFT_1333288 [Suillus paluster]
MISQLKTWVNFSTPEARNIVPKILASALHRELGLNTHEIYKRVPRYHHKQIPTGLRNHGGRSRSSFSKITEEDNPGGNGDATENREDIRDPSLTSKAYGKTEIKSDFNIPASDIWHWRLALDCEGLRDQD